MDLLYSRYANPMEFMRAYIENGRFGEWVENIYEMNLIRRREEDQKENDSRLWLAYVHSYTDKSFAEWKKSLTEKKEPEFYFMVDEQVDEVKNRAGEILRKISPG